MYASDEITTTLTIFPDDIRKWAKLPKGVEFTPQVEVRTDRDNKVSCYKIKIKNWKHREVKES